MQRNGYESTPVVFSDRNAYFPFSPQKPSWMEHRSKYFEQGAKYLEQSLKSSEASSKQFEGRSKSMGPSFLELKT